MSRNRTVLGVLPRPMWRSWIVAYVLICFGFMLVDIAAPTRYETGSSVLFGIGASAFAAGGCVFAAAIVHAILSLLLRAAGPSKERT